MIMTRHKIWTLTTIGFSIFLFGSQGVVCPLSGQSMWDPPIGVGLISSVQMFEPNNFIS